MIRMFMVFGFAILSSAVALASDTGVILTTDSAAGEATFEVKFVAGAKEVTVDLSKGVLPADEVEVNGLSGAKLSLVSAKDAVVTGNELVQLEKTTDLKTLKVALAAPAVEGDTLRIVLRTNDKV